jgi:hypothetical protein
MSCHRRTQTSLRDSNTSGCTGIIKSSPIFFYSKNEKKVNRGLSKFTAFHSAVKAAAEENCPQTSHYILPFPRASSELFRSSFRTPETIVDSRKESKLPRAISVEKGDDRSEGKYKIGD